MSVEQADVTVYGATGFTGRLIAEYLAGRAGDELPFTMALAGRNADKLATVRAELALDESTPIVVADGGDQSALGEMAGATGVVIAAAGPYQLHGSGVVAACAAAGTDYVDLCGEPNWIRAMIDGHAEEAERSGARIVMSCGFDSIPFDLGVFLLQELAHERFGAPVERVKGRVLDLKGAASGGTVASMMATMGAAAEDPAVGAMMLDPFALAPGSGPEQPAGAKAVFDEDLGTWAAPFVMAIINTKTVHRSNALLDHRYGAEFVYDEMLSTGPGDEGEAAARAMGPNAGFEGDGGMPEPGEGPSLEEREAGGFVLAFTGALDDDRSVRVTVAGDRDPGYGATSGMISQGALCLLHDDVPAPGGVWTPAAAMGRPLIDRLRRSGVLTIEEEVSG